jgi:hypothetical protein
MIGSNELQRILLSRSLGKRSLQGAGLALLLLIILLSVLGASDDGFWIFLVMTSVTIGGASGGAFYHLLDQLVKPSGWKKLFFNIACGIIYFTGLWLSLVYALSLVGLWD